MLSVIQPPSNGPITGATSVVIAQMASALPAFALGKLDSSSACDSGIIGPATAPCRTRNAISICSDGASPHRQRGHREQHDRGGEQAHLRRSAGSASR